MDDYSIIKRLGAGGFGTVHLAESKKDKKQVAVKEKFIFCAFVYQTVFEAFYSVSKFQV